MQRNTMEIERPSVAQRAEPGVKTILLYVQNDAAADVRLETALSLTRACDAHLTCLQVTSIEAYAAFDSLGGIFVMDDVVKITEDEELRLRHKVEEKLRHAGVAWDYAQVVGNIPTQIIRHAALTDLLVVGRETHQPDSGRTAIRLLGDLLYRSRTPLLIPGTDGNAGDPRGSAIIAWNGSYEAANAVRGAVGLLKLASDIRIIQVVEAEEDGRFPGKRLLEYLSRHGIHAELRVEPASRDDGSATADLLLSYAQSAGASYMVMGGYGHSRVGEFLFGGVTRSLLSDCPSTLLIAH